MAHLIEEFDLGKVNGTTWHKHPLYAQLDGPVPFDIAAQVGNFNVSKQPLYRTVGESYEKVNAFALVRDDLNLVVYPSVSETYTIVQNPALLQSVNEKIIIPSNGRIFIDSIGTLCNGGRFFINLGFEPFQIQGDGSKYINKIMLVNMFGVLKNIIAAHSTRVVCMNTIMIAVMQGILNKAFASIQHRKNIQQEMDKAVIDFAEIYAGLNAHEAWLSRLTATEINSGEENEFLENLFPIPVGTDDKPITKTIRDNRLEARNQVHNRRVNENTMTEKLNGSWYGMIQAVTAFADAPTPRQQKIGKYDAATNYWEGLYGKGDKLKQTALQLCPVK